MKKNSKACLVKFIIFSIFFLIPVFAFPSAIHAEDVDSALTLQALQAKVDPVMHSRQTSYTVNYSGNSTTLKTDIPNMIKNILSADDYLNLTLKNYKFSATTSNDVSKIDFTFTYWNTTEQDEYVNTKVDEILSQIITTDMSDLQKEKIIHDWIIKNVAYDSTKVKHSDYDALVSPNTTVCQGYSLLAYKMLNKAGIQTRIVEGTIGVQTHTWNLVNIGGAWYHLDVTLDDPVPDVAGSVTYTYYNLTSAQIQSDHSWSKIYPDATTDFNDTINAKLVSDTANTSLYQELKDKLNLKFLESDYTVNNPVELNSKIQEAIKNNQNKIEVRYMKGYSLAKDIDTAVKSISNITSYTYSATNYLRSSVLGDVILDLSINYSTPISITSVNLSNNDLTIPIGTTSKLTATILPDNASNKTFTWTTSNPAVATITNGIVKAVGAGTAEITATTSDGGHSATCNVKVIQGVLSIVVTSPSKYVKLGGDDITLTATVNPTNATDKSLTWTSSNPNVATVDSNGKVHAVAYGNATISATSVQAPTKVGKYIVVVPTPVGSLSINSKSDTVKMGSTLALSAILSPTNATNKTVTWTSSDIGIAKVSANGVVVPVSPGSVTVTATSTDGNYSATKNVTVINGVSQVIINKTSTKITKGSEETLTAAVTPSNATYNSLNWRSTNTNVATVDSNGNVHAVGYGTAVIVAASAQDANKYAKCTVTVPTPVTNVSITSKVDTVKIGSTLALRATITPTTATNKTVTWTSSDTSIAKVSTNGVVTPVAPGSVTITATTTDGNSTATIDLTVYTGVTSVTLNKTTTTIMQGSDETLTATVNPSNTSNKSLIWKSSNTRVVTVDSNGKVHGVAPGSAIITAISSQDSTKIAKCTVAVKK